MYNFDASSSTFHQELRRARTDLSLTQAELANRLGISSVMTQRYEMPREKPNSARPSPITLRKINEFFGQGSDENTTSSSAKANLEEPAETLDTFPLEDLLTEIQRRGYQISLQSKN